MKVVKASIARKNFAELIDNVSQGKCDGYFIERYGRNIAVLLPAQNVARPSLGKDVPEAKTA